MAKSRENMLEAFRASGASGASGGSAGGAAHPGGAGQAPGPGVPGSGGLFSPPPGAVAPSGGPIGGGSEGTWNTGSHTPLAGGQRGVRGGEGGLLLPMGALPFLLLQLAVIALFFSAGFLAGSGGLTQASGGGGDLDGGGLDASAPAGGFQLASPAVAQGNAASQGALLAPRPDPGRTRAEVGAPGIAGGEGSGVDRERTTPADRAFHDPRNQVTVTVFSAYDNDFGQDRTWKLYRHLHDQGLPVVQPVSHQGLFLLFVGAATSKDGLERLRDRIRSTYGPDGRDRPFQTAYFDRIDKYRGDR